MRLNRRSFVGGAALVAGHAPLFAGAQALTPHSGWTKTKGGNGGRVLRVTSLASEGLGTLRAALAVTGPRRILFDVAGVIDLGRKSLAIRDPFVTIDGTMTFGTVAWEDGDERGVAFDEPLHPGDEARLRDKVAHASGLPLEVRHAFEDWTQGLAR